MVLLILLVMVGTVGAVIFMERGHRRIPVQYAKRVVGRRVYGGQSSHLPLKLNTAGVITNSALESAWPSHIKKYHYN